MDIDRQSHEDVLNPESPTDLRGRNPSIASSSPSVDPSPNGLDVNMTDAPAILAASAIKPPPPPWPGQSNVARPNSIPGQKAPDLRVQMPPASSFSNPNTSGSGTLSENVTPSSAAGSIAQSPFGATFSNAFTPTTASGVVQSPAKGPKKLSLSDYKAARAKKAEVDLASKKPGSSPIVPPATPRPSLSTIEETTPSGILEAPAIVDTPMTEKTLDSALSLESHSSDPSPKPNLPYGQPPNGIL